MTTATERVAWTRAITHNLGLKLMALGLSIMLFSLVHSDVDAQRSMFIDVVALLPPADAERMLVSELPTQVKVTLRGSRSRLSDLSREDFSPIQLDLREGTSGYYYFRPSDVDVAGGVNVISVDPATVPLAWAPTAKKRLPVYPRIEGKLDVNHRLRANAQARPGEVTVRGPKSVLSDLSTVSTDALSLDGLNAGHHTRRVALAPLPKLVSYDGDAHVEVDLDVDAVVAERVLRRLDVAVLGAPSAMLRPERVAVTLRGPQERLTELDPEEVVPFIEMSGAESPTLVAHDIKVRGVPEGLEVVRIAPPSVLARALSAGGSAKGKP